MHRDLVERRGWFSEADYKEGLTLAQLAPGPLATQLAIYLGFIHYRILGATLAVICFILPSFFMVVTLGWIYKIYGGLPWMQSAFYGVGAAVIGIMTHSAYQLTRKTIGKDRLLAAIYLVVAIVTALTETETLSLFLAAGLLTMLIKAPPKLKALAGLLPVSFSTASSPTAGLLWKITLFFTKAGTFVFGSGLAIVPFLYGGVVKEYQWLTLREFLDAVAVAMITPGPDRKSVV